MNKTILITIVAMIITGLCGCNKIDKSKIAGVYILDKVVERDTSVSINDYKVLIIDLNNTFTLKKNENDSMKISGNWEILSSSKTESIIQFKYSSRSINGLLNGSIFYFDYPNDFYLGKYRNTLYVKKQVF